MARDFPGTNDNCLQMGTGAVGQDLNGTAIIWYSLRFRVDTIAGGANNNRLLEVIINSGSVGLLINIDGSGTDAIKVSGRSVGTDSLRSNKGSTAITAGDGVWHGLAGTLNFSGDTINFYYDNDARDDQAAAFGNSSWTQGTPVNNDRIGGTDTTTADADHFDGAIVDVALGTGGMTASNAAALIAGFSPLAVMPTTITHYWPLLGRFDPEPDLVSARNATIVGSVGQADHPRTILPRWRAGGAKKIAAAATGQPTWKRFGGVPFIGGPRASQGARVW